MPANADSCPNAQTFAKAEPGSQPWTDLVALVLDDDAAILARHGRFYLPERDVNVLRRNALIALGNTVRVDGAGGLSQRVREALAAGATSSDDAVRHAAAYAHRQILGPAAHQ